LPGGATWRASVEQVPADVRHLAIHEGHLVAANRHDALALDEGMHAAPAFTLTGTAAEVRARLDALAEGGITEVAYQPAGPDIVRELRAFMVAAG
jgi:5,10-methylenetetrahydromethanopterin reductase